MANRKDIRTRGKFSFSRFFQKFEEGESAAIVREQSKVANFPKRIQGRTGVVCGKRGRSYIVKIKDQNKPKIYLIDPVHLKRIANLEKKE